MINDPDSPDSSDSPDSPDSLDSNRELVLTHGTVVSTVGQEGTVARAASVLALLRGALVGSCTALGTFDAHVPTQHLLTVGLLRNTHAHAHTCISERLA